MLMRRKRIYDLRNNSVDFQTIDRIIRDMQQYHIYDPELSVTEYTLTVDKRRRLARKDDINIYFEKDVFGREHILYMHAQIRFVSHRVYHEISVCMKMSAFYDYEEYDSKLQDYMYSYMSHMVESDPKIQRRKSFFLPEQLHNMNRNGEGWRSIQTQTFNYVNESSYESIDRIAPRRSVLDSSYQDSFHVYTFENAHNKESINRDDAIIAHRTYC